MMRLNLKSRLAILHARKGEPPGSVIIAHVHADLENGIRSSRWTAQFREEMATNDQGPAAQGR
jgi:hypothetical protein